MGGWTIELFGFPVELSFLSFMLPLFIWYITGQPIKDKAKREGIKGINMLSASTACVLLASVALHELSHAAVAAWLGVSVNGAGILPIGAYVRLGEVSVLNQLLITLAGPVAQALGGLIIAFTVKSQPASFSRRAWIWLAYMITWIAAINLLPIGPMDGSRAFIALLSLIFDDPGKLRHLGPVLTVLLILLWIKIDMKQRIYGWYGIKL